MEKTHGEFLLGGLREELLFGVEGALVLLAAVHAADFHLGTVEEGEDLVET